MDALDKLEAAMREAIETQSLENCLAAATGMFVGLVIACAEARGTDPSKTIHIDGGAQRDITIHAEKK